MLLLAPGLNARGRAGIEVVEMPIAVLLLLAFSAEPGAPCCEVAVPVPIMAQGATPVMVTGGGLLRSKFIAPGHYANKNEKISKIHLEERENCSISALA